MSRISALASKATALTLSLTGIPVEECADVKEAERRCLELLDDGPEVLIVEEKLIESFSERTQDRLARHRGEPLIVHCPAFDEEESDVDEYLSSIIKPAVGFEIRLA